MTKLYRTTKYISAAGFSFCLALLFAGFSQPLLGLLALLCISLGVLMQSLSNLKTFPHG